MGLEAQHEGHRLRQLAVGQQELIWVHPKLRELRGNALTEWEAEEEATCYYENSDGLLMRKWRWLLSTDRWPFS